MFVSDRCAGPLASLWPDYDGPALARLLTRLPVAPADDRLAWRAGGFDQVTLDWLRQAAASDLDQPWPHPLAHAWARYRRDGDREEYQQALFARQARLRRAVLMAALTDQPAWLDQAADGLALACEQLSWCWPAHDEFAAAARLALPQADQPFLDLGAAELAAELAWADAVLGPRLDQAWAGLRQRLRHEAERRVIAPFLDVRDWWWIDGRDGVGNWNPWIHSNLVVTALGLIDDDARRSQVLATALAGVDRFVAALPPDGAVHEGYSYWWEGAGRLLDLLGWLKQASAGRLDGFGLPAVRATVGFPGAMWLGEADQPGWNWYVNYGDAQAKQTGEPWHSLYAAARETGDVTAAHHALDRWPAGQPVFAPEHSLGRQLAALFDADWADRRRPTGVTPERTGGTWLASIQLMVARQPNALAGLTVAAKAGSNGDSHNHLDVGAFIVALDGVPFLVDAGRGTYTAQTFGPNRYDLWLTGSDWHNLPAIAGQSQAVGAAFRASQVSCDGSRLSCDIAGAYDLPAGQGWRRRVRLDADTVQVDDDWTDARPSPAPSLWRLIVAGQVDLAEPGRLVVTTLGGRRVDLVTEPAMVPLVEVKGLDDPMLRWDGRLTRLTFTIDQPGRFHLTVMARPLTPPEESP